MWRLSLCALQSRPYVFACQRVSACKQESPLSAPSHNQWPFCLSWWMGEKCGVSTLVLHTVSPPFSLSLSLAVLAISSLFLTHAELLMVNSLHFRHVLQLYMCTFDERTHTHTHMCVHAWACVCFVGSFSPLPPLHERLAGAASIPLCYVRCLCGWCVPVLWWVYVCVLSPGQSGESVPRL